MGYTNYNVARPGFIIDDNVSSRVSRQVDFSRVPASFQDQDGNKVVSGSTIMSQTGTGKIVPRSTTEGAITNLTETGDVATATEADHGRQVGDVIVVSGAAQSGYNGTWTIASVPDEDTYTFDVGATVSDDSGGAVVITTAIGILEATAMEGAENASLSGQSLLVSGSVYETLLADAEDEDFTTYQTELKAVGQWWFEAYVDSRSS